MFNNMTVSRLDNVSHRTRSKGKKTVQCTHCAVRRHRHEIGVDKATDAYLIRICSGITAVNSKLGVTNNYPQMLCSETVWAIVGALKWVNRSGPWEAQWGG